LCFAVLIFDGYDLVIYGATVPALLHYKPWGLSAASAGLLSSVALFGIVAGALGAAALAAKVGRRRTILISLVVFSVAMGLTALAPTPEFFGVTRALAGLGLGVALPTCITVTADFSRSGRKNLNNAVMFSGYSVGGVIASLIALLLLAPLGFRVMFAFGAVPLLVLVPLMLRFLPESPSDLVRRGQWDEAIRVTERYGLPRPAAPAAVSRANERASAAAPSIWRGRIALATVAFCAAGVFGQLLIYGMNTWLPQIMIMAGYSLRSSLGFLLAINIGSILGSVGSASLADRLGAKPLSIVAFGAAVVALLVLAFSGAPTVVLLLLVAIVGYGAIGSLTLMYGYVGAYYPAASRAAAMSATFGIARFGAVVATLGGGGFLELGLPTAWNFLVWVAPAFLGAVTVFVVPAKPPAATPARSTLLPGLREPLHGDQ
jgi:AAHS family benzoate transporter-like MFS transporter